MVAERSKRGGMVRGVFGVGNAVVDMAEEAYAIPITPILLEGVVNEG